VTYDPSCSYAHSEFELCLIRMFGGFSTMRSTVEVIATTQSDA
jgi:fructosamine-3-kinase